MIKLYLPYGHLRSVEGYGQVMIHWFVIDRQTPVAPYGQLVERYSQLSAEDRVRAEQMVDELFSEPEYFELRRFLYEVRHEDLRVSMMVPPVNALRQDNAPNRKLIRPFRALPEGDDGCFVRLCDQPDYSLPFAVWGYYAVPSSASRRNLPSSSS